MITWTKMFSGRVKYILKPWLRRTHLHPFYSWIANRAEKRASLAALTSVQCLSFAGVPQGLLPLTL